MLTIKDNNYENEMILDKKIHFLHVVFLMLHLVEYHPNHDRIQSL